MLSTPSESAARHASRIAATVVCCGRMCTPILNAAIAAIVRYSATLALASEALRVLPQPEPADKRIGVIDHPRARRQLVQQFGVATPEHQIVRLQRRHQIPDDLKDIAPPLLLAQPLQPAQTDKVLVCQALLVWQMR